MNRRGKTPDREGFSSRLINVLAAIVMASVLAVGAAAVLAFDRAVEPELANRTRLIGSIIRAELQRALEVGIPLDAMAGLDHYLEEALEKFQEVQRIAVVGPSGQEVAVVERPKTRSLFGEAELGEVIAFGQPVFVLPILDGNRLVGKISVAISPLFVQTRLRDVFLDVIVIAIVATLVALELALAVAAGSVRKPLDRLLHLLAEQRDGNFLHRIHAGGIGGLARVAMRFNDHALDLAERVAALSPNLREQSRAAAGAEIAEAGPLPLRLSDINDIRIALFLFSVATEVAAAFLPLYARAASRPSWLAPELAAAAPLLLYLVAVAVLSPLSGPLARRFGPRRVFLASVPPSILALAAMGFSDSLLAIAFWRGVTAVFYATATISCQEYALRAAGDRKTARPLGAFVVVLYGGVFCGSALGGVIAGRFGFEATFLTGASIAALSGILGFVAMRGRAGDALIRAAVEAVRPDARGWLDRRFLALLVGIAVPMNAATAVLVWYLAPIILAEAGSGPAEIARVVMLYYLAVVLFGPKVSSLADGPLGPMPLVLAGAMGSAAALLSLAAGSGFWAVTIAVAGLGFSHTLMRAPLYALAMGLAGGSGAAMNALRLGERTGAIIGLAASALLLRSYGAETGSLALGITVLSGLLLYGIVETERRFHRRSRGGE